MTVKYSGSLQEFLNLQDRFLELNFDNSFHRWIIGHSLDIQLFRHGTMIGSSSREEESVLLVPDYVYGFMAELQNHPLSFYDLLGTETTCKSTLYSELEKPLDQLAKIGIVHIDGEHNITTTDFGFTNVGKRFSLGTLDNVDVVYNDGLIKPRGWNRVFEQEQRIAAALEFDDNFRRFYGEESFLRH